MGWNEMDLPEDSLVISHDTDYPIPSRWIRETPRQIQLILSDNDLEIRVPLGNGRHFSNQPITNLGVFEDLPTEVLREVFLQSDLWSLTTLRGVNRGMRLAIDNVLEYGRLLEHCPNTIRGMLALQIEHVSLLDLYRAVTSPFCRCGGFGRHIHLLACKRVCFRCFIDPYCREYRPLFAHEVAEDLQIPRHLVYSLPTMTSIPGKYSKGYNAHDEYKPIDERWTMFDYDAAKKFALKYHGSEEQMEWKIRLAECVAWRILKNTNPSHRVRWQLQNLTLDGREYELETVRRCMAVVTAPHFNPATRTSEVGFYCAACRGEVTTRWVYIPQPEYNAEMMREHIKRAGMIVDGDHDESTCVPYPRHPIAAWWDLRPSW